MERFIERFPSTGRFWVLYIEHEMRQGNAVRVEELFKRSLVSCLSLPLWRLYLRYVSHHASHWLTPPRERLIELLL